MTEHAHSPIAFSETSPPLSEGHLDDNIFAEHSLKSMRSSKIKYIENSNKKRQELNKKKNDSEQKIIVDLQDIVA